MAIDQSNVDFTSRLVNDSITGAWIKLAIVNKSKHKKQLKKVVLAAFP